MMNKYVFEVRWIENMRGNVSVQVSRVNAANIKGACSQIEQHPDCEVVLKAEMLTGHAGSDVPVERAEQFSNIYQGY